MAFPFRIEPKTLPAIIVGVAVIVVALVMMSFVWRAKKSFESSEQTDERLRLHAERQFRRRMQVSVMMMILGILIPVGDQLDDLFKQHRPLLFLVWIMCIFALLFWMVLLALGDWVSTVVFSKVEQGRLQHQRRELEEEIRRYQASKNGHAVDRTDDSISS